MQKIRKLTETQVYGYSSECTQWELSKEYSHDRVKMIFIIFLSSCALDESNLIFRRVKNSNQIKWNWTEIVYISLQCCSNISYYFAFQYLYDCLGLEYVAIGSSSHHSRVRYSECTKDTMVPPHHILLTALNIQHNIALSRPNTPGTCSSSPAIRLMLIYSYLSTRVGYCFKVSVPVQVGTGILSKSTVSYVSFFLPILTIYTIIYQQLLMMLNMKNIHKVIMQ